MKINIDYAAQFVEMGYKRKIIAFKLCDKPPEYAEPYGDSFSFLCAISAEAWEEGKNPFYITNKNSLCGGPLYSGFGGRKVNKEEFNLGMSQTIGIGKAYETREQFRKMNQQIPHIFKTHKYLIIGTLEKIETPDMVMVVSNVYKIMRLCKTYTWKTGELVQGLSGSSWCTSSFPQVYRTKTISFATGDEQSRIFMGLEEGELSCFIHWDTLPIIMDNYKNIQEGPADY